MKPLNRLALAGLSSRLRNRWYTGKGHRLWHAWLVELQGLLPPPWRARWLASPREHLLRWPLAGDRVLPAADQRVILLLPEEHLLAVPLHLPAAATRRLHQVLGYELDKYTPFPAADLHYMGRVEHKDSTWARVLLVAVPRARLHGIIEHCRREGISLAGIDGVRADGQRLGVDLLPADQRPAANRTGRLTRGLALICALLALADMGLWLHSRNAQVNAMQAQVTEQRGQVAQVQALRRELLTRQGAAQYLTQQKAAHPTLASLLVDLTACLGPDTWIEQLELGDDGGLSLAGQSTKASTLIGQAKGCRTLTDVHFEGIIQPDETTGKDRFSLRAQLAKEAPDAQTP
jgi:general secretion pathway protein L